MYVCSLNCADIKEDNYHFLLQMAQELVFSLVARSLFAFYCIEHLYLYLMKSNMYFILLI